VPAVPADKDDVVMAKADGAMVMEAFTEVLCAGLLESVTLAVKLKVPAAVGVPEMRPLEEFSERPAGRLPEEMDQV
jgi:hypothetical protein